MFQALGRLIFKGRCWQNMACHGTSDYSAWLSMLKCLPWRVFSLMELFEPHESGQKAFGVSYPGFWDPGILAGFLAFSWNFGEIKNRIESEVKRKHNTIGYSRNSWCIFLSLVRISIQRKRWLRSWHMSASNNMGCNEKKKITKSDKDKWQWYK